MLSKSKVIESIKKMPDQFTLDELFERMIFLQKIEIGLAQAAEGKTVSHENLLNDWKDELKKREAALENGTSVGRSARDVIAKYLSR